MSIKFLIDSDSSGALANNLISQELLLAKIVSNFVTRERIGVKFQKMRILYININMC